MVSLTSSFNIINLINNIKTKIKFIEYNKNEY